MGKIGNLIFLNMKKYKSRGLKIISITSDVNKKYWESAIRQDSMIWVSLKDLKIEEGRISDIYNVKLIPESFLIDPTGKIIAMNLYGKELEKKLYEIFKK